MTANPYMKKDTETIDEILSKIIHEMETQNERNVHDLLVRQIIRNRRKAIRDTLERVNVKYDIAALTEGLTTMAEVCILANLCVLSDSESHDEDRSGALEAAHWIPDHIQGDIVLSPEFEDIPDLESV